MSNLLYVAKKDELIEVLKRDGITKDNIGSHTCLYVENGIIKASNDGSNISPDIYCGYPNVEAIGFWVWGDYDTLENINNKEFDNVSNKIAALFEVNLNALKELL